MLRFLSIFLGISCCLNFLAADEQLTISDFLHFSKEQHQNMIDSPQNSQEIHFVMGNESADLDSIVSSIAYAYLLTYENADQNQLYIPLLNIHREEMALRKDALYLLQLFGLSVDDLLFLDDNVSLDLLLAQEKLRISLVDHNLLRPSQEHLSPAIERIVDHHFDENRHYPLLSEENKLIAVVGSATTLIAEKILSNTQMALTPELATLLLGPILIDTANLQSVEKTTKRDTNVVETLLTAASGVIPEGFYEKLMAAKSDVSGLTPAMLLSKDFKEYLDGQLLYGISSLPNTVGWWSEDESTLCPILEKFAGERQLSFLIVLTANQDPQGPKRKIIVYSDSAESLATFESYVRTDPALSAILSPGPKAADGRISYYTAINFIARKQLQPLLHFPQN